jgi:signal transduction histidine kinase
MIPALRGRVGAGGVFGRDNGHMVQVANRAVRGLVFVLVGLFTFLAPWSGRAQFAIQAAAFVVSAVLMVAVVLPDRSRPTRDRYPRVLPYALGCIVVVCNAASMTDYGGTFILISVSAMVAAGSGASLLTGWGLAGLGALVLIPAGVALHANGLVIFEYPVLLVLGLFLGYTLRAHRVQAEQAASLLAQTERLREEQSRVATLDERTRIAREIHDVLAHSLGALAVQIQVAEAVLTDQRDVDRAVELLDQARRMANEGLDETRRAVHALRGETLPLPQGLARLGANHQRRHGSLVNVEVNGVPRTLTPDASLAIARTAQEALVNTAKHAPRQPVDIRLDYADADTSLVVANRLGEDGWADRPDQGSGLSTVDGGYGLAGMRERLLLLQGTLSAGRTGNEWIVVAKVPQ